MNPTDETPSIPGKTKQSPGTSAVRKFQIPKNRIRIALMACGALAAMGGAWFWWGNYKIPAPDTAAQKAAKPISAPPASQPASAIQEISRPASAPVASQPEVPAAPEESAHEKAPLASDREPDAAQAAQSRTRPVAAKDKRKHDKIATSDAFDQKSTTPDEKPESAPIPAGSIDKQIRQLTTQQQADNEFRRANGLVQQGNVNDAMAAYEAALQLDPEHDAARQALVVLLLEKRRNTDAERLLQEGLKHNIKNGGFAMLLARIQIERDASWSALLTLQKTLPYAEQQADYQAFVAALLQRLNRHKEAVAHYRIAVQLAPDSGVWLMGLGISLQALQRNEEARDAFQRAQETHTLNADLQAFVAQRLRELKRF